MRMKREEKLYYVYLIHFGLKDPDSVTCFNCLDYKEGLCEGFEYDDVIECMMNKVKNESIMIGRI